MEPDKRGRSVAKPELEGAMECSTKSEGKGSTLKLCYPLSLPEEKSAKSRYEVRVSL